MSRVPEKLSILLDASQGIMTRLHSMISFQIPPLLNKDLDDLLDHLSKKFPNYPTGTEKLKQFPVFQQRALDLSKALRDFYMTFVDLLTWREAAWAMLDDLSKSLIDMHFEANHELTVRVLDLLTAFVQMHLLVQRVPERRLLIVVYARAVHCTEGNSESSFTRVASFVDAYDERTLARLRDEFSGLCMRLGDGLLSCQPLLSRWADPARLRDSQTLNVVDSIERSNQMVQFDEHLQLMWLDRARAWVLFGFLVCPSELQRPGALLLLRAALADTWFVNIYRDQYMDIHTPYRDLYSTWKGPSFDLAEEEHKQPIKEAANLAVSDSGRSHAQTRNLLRMHMPPLLAVLRECPALVAPRLSLILAAMSLARAELLWFLTHQHYFLSHLEKGELRLPFKAKERYVTADELQASYADPAISDLIFFVDALQQLLATRATQKIIRDFYIEQLSTADATHVRTQTEILLRDPSMAQNATVKALLAENAELLPRLPAALADAASTASVLDGFRLNWQHALCGLSQLQGGVTAKLLKDVCAKFNAVVQRSRFVDQLAVQAKQFGSLHSLWFFNSQCGAHPPLIDSIFESSLRSWGGQAAHCLAFVRLLHSALDNVHRMCPDELRTIGTRAIKLGHAYLGAVMQVLDENIRVVVMQKFGQLAQQYSPAVVSDNMELRLKQAAQGQPPPVMRAPGFESAHAHRQAIADLRASQKIIGEICTAIRENPTVVIWDEEISTREFLLDKLSTSIRGLIRRVTVTPQGVEQPTVLLHNLRIIISSFAVILQYINIDVHDIFKNAFLLEFCESDAGSAGQELVFGHEPSDAAQGDVNSLTCLTQIANWYTKSLFGSGLTNRGVFFSDYAQAFVAGPGARLAVERWADPQELRALCVLLGPGGARLLEAETLHALYLQAANVREALLLHRNALELLASRATEEVCWRDTVTRLNTKRAGEEALPSDLSKVCMSFITVGCMLRFRRSLQHALAAVSQQQVPQLFDVLRQLHRRLPPMPAPSAAAVAAATAAGGSSAATALNAESVSLAPLEQLCADVGLAKLVDVRLVDVLQRLCLGREGEVWAFLPELLGLQLAADEFRAGQAYFLVQEEGYRNNAQMCVEAAVALQVAATLALLPSRDHTPQGVQHALRRGLNRLVRAVALALLTFKPLADRQKSDASAHNQQHLLPLFDHLLVATHGLVSHAYVEQFFPYSLVRQNFVSLAQAQVPDASAQRGNFDFEEKKES